MHKITPQHERERIENWTRKSQVIETRQVNKFKQFKLLLNRCLTQVYRLPTALVAVVFMATFQGLTQGSIFGDVGAKNFSPIDMANNQKVASNYLGLAFMVGSDQFITMSFAQVLAIPVARPIFMREIANRMYSPTSYYLASCTASILTFILYPIISSLVSFYFFGFD